MEHYCHTPLPNRTALAAIIAADRVVDTVSNAYASLRAKAMSAKGAAAILRVPFKLTDKPAKALWSLYQNTAQSAWAKNAAPTRSATSFTVRCKPAAKLLHAYDNIAYASIYLWVHVRKHAFRTEARTVHAARNLHPSAKHFVAKAARTARRAITFTAGIPRTVLYSTPANLALRPLERMAYKPHFEQHL